jgi:hypothetical protein
MQRHAPADVDCKVVRAGRPRGEDATMGLAQVTGATIGNAIAPIACLPLPVLSSRGLARHWRLQLRGGLIWSAQLRDLATHAHAQRSAAPTCHPKSPWPKSFAVHWLHCLEHCQSRVPHRAHALSMAWGQAVPTTPRVRHRGRQMTSRCKARMGGSLSPSTFRE